MIYGLGAALGWGFADLGAAVVGRRMGSLATLVVAQAVGLLSVAVLVLVVRPGWGGSAYDVVLLALNGGVVAAAYVSLYRGLELGPVALVSPIVSSYAIVTVVLAVALLGESMSGLEVAGAVVTLIGAVLTATDPRQFGEITRMPRPGVPWALVSSLLFGVGTFIVGRTAQEVGWLSTMEVGRTFSFAWLLALVAIRRPSFTRGGVLGLAGAAAVGLVDIFGFCMYAWGSERGLVAIVTAASATFALIPVAGGIVLLGERPALTQVLGIALVVGGLVALGLGGG